MNPSETRVVVAEDVFLRPIDADLAADWARRKACHWLDRSPMDKLESDPLPRAIRARVAGTVIGVAKVMVRVPVLGVRARGGRRVSEIAAWLAAACDAASQPNRATARERVVAPLGVLASAVPALTPLRRWVGSFPTLVESLGVQWLRGAVAGEGRFLVFERDGAVAVVEYGAPGDDLPRRGLMIDAAAEAVVRHARNTGRDPAGADDVRAVLTRDAERDCLAPGARLPDWLIGLSEQEDS